MLYIYIYEMLIFDGFDLMKKRRYRYSSNIQVIVVCISYQS